MDTKYQIIEELNDVSGDILTEVLDFLQFLKKKAEQEKEQDLEDLHEAREILANLANEETVSWQVLQQEIGS